MTDRIGFAPHPVEARDGLAGDERLTGWTRATREELESWKNAADAPPVLEAIDEAGDIDWGDVVFPSGSKALASQIVGRVTKDDLMQGFLTIFDDPEVRERARRVCQTHGVVWTVTNGAGDVKVVDPQIRFDREAMVIALTCEEVAEAGGIGPALSHLLKVEGYLDVQGDTLYLVEHDRHPPIRLGKIEGHASRDQFSIYLDRICLRYAGVELVAP